MSRSIGARASSHPLGRSFMRSLLITGGAGFIGGNFVHYWANRYPSDRIMVLDALTYAGNVSTIEKLIADSRIAFVHGDITDAALLQRLLPEHAVDRQSSDPRASLRQSARSYQPHAQAAGVATVRRR